MGIEYYLFASYVFILVCAALIISKRMFADVKRQKRMLDAKEKKLLLTFQTLEDAMDEFYDIAAEAKEDLAQRRDELEALVINRPAVLHEITEIPTAARNKNIPAAIPAMPPKRHPAKSAVPDQLAFEQVFNELTEKTGVPLSAIHEKILTLSAQGRTRTEIAKKLAITQNEVELVIGMNKISDMAQ